MPGIKQESRIQDLPHIDEHYPKGVSVLEVDIARNVRIIEWLQAELVHQSGSFLHALVKNSEDEALNSLAAIVISANLLARRLGYGLDRLDAKILEMLQTSMEQGHELEKRHGDISALLQHNKSR